MPFYGFGETRPLLLAASPKNASAYIPPPTTPSRKRPRVKETTPPSTRCLRSAQPRTPETQMARDGDEDMVMGEEENGEEAEEENGEEAEEEDGEEAEREGSEEAECEGSEEAEDEDEDDESKPNGRLP